MSNVVKSEEWCT